MEIKLSICPHDTAKGVERWYSFAKSLEEKVGYKVDLITFHSFEEEYKKLDTELIHIHYANPFTQVELFNKGYIPLAKFKGQKDEFFLISKGSFRERQIIKLALPHFNFSGVAFLHLMVDNISLVTVKDFFEVFDYVKDGKADVGIMYGENWQQIQDKNGVEKISDTVYETCHLFMVHPSVYEKVKSGLLSIESVEQASVLDINKSKRFVEYSKQFTDIWKVKSVYKSIEASPFIGFMIYQEKIVYANDYFCKLTGFSLEELLSIKTIEFVKRIKEEDVRNKVLNVVNQRLKGSFGLRTYSKFGFYKRDMEIIYVDMYGDTILYQGKPSGLIFVVDKTKEVKLERLYSLIREVNQILVNSTSEKEILNTITKTVASKFQLKLVWVGEEEKDTKIIKPVFWAGEASGYLDGLKVSSSESLPEGRGPSGIAYREDRIVINPDSNTTQMIEPWKDNLLNYQLLSSATIPIKKDGKVKYVLNLYSDEKNFFTPEVLDVLAELKQDIEFGLAKVEQLKDLITISEAIKNSKSWIVIADKDDRIIYVSNYVCELSGYSLEELIGSKPNIFKSGYHDEEFYKKLYQSLESGKPFDATFVNRKKDGSMFYIDQTIFPISLPDGEIRYMSVGRDITKEKLMDLEINRYKFYDPVTELYNLYGFMFKVGEQLEDSKIGVLVLIDIANFTSINKIYGFYFGDKVLKNVALRLKNVFRDYDTVARVGNDEFAVFITLPDKRYIDTIYEKIFSNLSKRITIDGIDISLSLNAGLAVYPEDGENFEDLYRNCSIALRESKIDGPGVFRFYNVEIESKVHTIHAAHSLVSKAFEKKLFKFYYQPYFYMSDLSLAGFEALIRIVDEDGKVYTPGSFIDYLENSSFLFDFEKWALEEIAEKSARWNIRISLNMSARNFYDVASLEKFVDIIKSNQNAKLTYEITERVFIRNLNTVKDFINAIKSDKNLKIAIDDFGTGYSSLTYLKEMPVDILKIDMSFIRNMENSDVDKAIVKTIISFSNDIGMASLAEGVETWQQYEMLKSMGCTYVQGYLFSKPLPEEEITKLYNLT